ncbi:MAG TPA: hypothetical protein VK864_18035 [Longimicrobiales bacterium]|nr:hypothetical protein [Longimicrobiales bacterium]
MDCVTAEGAAFIGYRAVLRWGWLKLGFSSSFSSDPDGVTHEYQRLRRSSRPAIFGDRVDWTSKPLELQGRWQAIPDSRFAMPDCAIEQRLLNNPNGTIDWYCVAPCADVRIEFRDGVAMQGLGYAERLRMTIPPWLLPFRKLYWGRFCSREESLVWIHWDGDRPMTLVRHNAAEVADGAVSKLGVCASGLALEWDDRGRLLQNRPIVSGALARLKLLSGRLPPAFKAAREEKWLSRATLRSSGRAVPGWAIREVVHLA